MIMGGAGGILRLSFSSSSTAATTARSSFSILPSLTHLHHRFTLPKFLPPPHPRRVFLGFTALCISTTTISDTASLESNRHSILLEKLRIRHLKESIACTTTKTQQQYDREIHDNGSHSNSSSTQKKKKKKTKKIENNMKENVGRFASNFEELGLTGEVMAALEEMGISVPTEIQSLGIPAVIAEKSVVLGSHTGSGKTLAYLLPLVQLLRRDEALYGMLMKPRRPRAVVLCPTRELSEQVFRVAKSISHHARFRCTMVSGGTRLRPQEDSLNCPIDMVVGTPGRVLQHIEEGNIVYGDIKYLVLDEADTMFDRGFGPDIRKFLVPLKNRALKSDGLGFQTVLVSATMTKAVQKLVDEEFQGIEHVRTSTLHKKIASARHDFIKLAGSENKLEALLQVLEPSLAKGNRVMVFCNTLNSSRAVDHFLRENQFSTVNYHGEVPAEERVQNLNKFKSDDGDCPTLVCTDLAARGLDLDVDHVIMFDFPLNSIDYLHRTGRTARMDAKGKVTSLVAKKDLMLAACIEEAISKNESLESLSVDNVRRDAGRPRLNELKGKGKKSVKISNQKNDTNVSSTKSSGVRGKAGPAKRTSGPKFGRVVTVTKPKQPPVKATKPLRSSNGTTSKRAVSGVKTRTKSQKSNTLKSPSKLNVVSFRGRSSFLSRKDSMRAT